jgi:hypothetical protein
MHETDRAFETFSRANELLRRPFSIGTVRHEFDRVMETFSRERLPALTPSSSDSELPIFVVSMPRTGSTLVEQILAAHPNVHGAGEIDDMMQRLRELPKEVGDGGAYPEVVERMDRRTADRLASRYLGRVRGLAPEAERIVDKYLQNFRLLGLIALLFPRARVIWCRRDPMDVCLSCWMLPLSPVALPYTTDLRDLGLYHREHDRLMRHWLDVLELPILEVSYEDLVADQERVSRAIVAFAGVAWDDACLRFHESKREVATASYDQVRRPIYTTAVRRHERYAAHLGRLREGLGL